jgi:AGZA family xanthine/uracil permease-like MFS transporter
MPRVRWACWGDLNAFFGLMLDNVTVMVILVGVLTTAEPGFTAEFVVRRMIPGTALGVLLGDLAYTLLALRLARRSGRSDVTAMPLGLDTPSTFAVSWFILLPVLAEAEAAGRDQDTAMVFAWHTGAVVLVLCGLFKTALSPLGNAVRRWVPRAGLLGSLAAVALALIAFLPLLMDIGAAPLVGFLSLSVVLVSLVAHRPLPARIPGALAAVLVGVVVYYLGLLVQEPLGWDLVPPSESFSAGESAPAAPLPQQVWQWSWWLAVWWKALEKLPIALPFALATVVGGIDCTESAAAAGDEYDTRAVLVTEAATTLAAGLLGGVIQSTPYIGHPAYKKMGGLSAYTLATALFIGAAGFLGWFAYLFVFLPRAALYPILVYVGLEITAQSFRATPVRHYPALALAVLPLLASMAIIPLNMALGGRAPTEGSAVVVQTLRGLSNGFIVTSLLWAAALATILDGRYRRAALYLLVAAGGALVGVIHSPLATAPLAWPETVMAQLPAAARYQTPYHWASAYALAAVLLLLLSFVHTGPTAEGEDRAGADDHGPS